MGRRGQEGGHWGPYHSHPLEPLSWLPPTWHPRPKAILSGPSGPTGQADQLSCPSTMVPWHPSLLSLGIEGLRLGSHQEETSPLGWLTQVSLCSHQALGFPEAGATADSSLYPYPLTRPRRAHSSKLVTTKMPAEFRNK